MLRDMGLIPNLGSLRYRFIMKMGLMLVPLFMVAWIAVFALHSQRHSLDLILQEALHEMEPVLVVQDKMQKAVSLLYHHLLEDDKDDYQRQFDTLKVEIDSFLARQQALQSNREGEWKSFLTIQQRWQNITAAAAEIFTLRQDSDFHDTVFLYQRVDRAYREIADEIDHIHAVAYGHIRDAEIAVRAVEDKAVWAVYVTLLTGIVIIILVGFLLARSVLLPMRVLGAGARELTSGNLDYRLQVDRDDEFGALMRTFNEMAAALQSGQEELKNLAIRDPLTGLYNHREFFRLLQDEVHRSERYAHPLSLLMIDLDKFKEINDTLGHLTGDHVLQHVAAVIGEQIRKSDHASRYGGDEFAILLPETDLQEAFEFAERLQQAVLLRPLTLGDGKPLQVTLSIGVASFPQDAKDFMDLVAVADHALYRAKGSRERKVCCGRHL